jgi:Zn-finger protein
MASGLMVFGLMIVVLGCGFYMAFIRAPRCARCHIPLQPVAEATRGLGAHVGETTIYYECADCSQAVERTFLHTHVS